MTDNQPPSGGYSTREEDAVRLIDADALPIVTVGGIDAVTKGDLAIAPTVRCEECEYREGGECLYPEMMTYPVGGGDGLNFVRPTINFGCSYFERRTP
jgi:hypothetical protein